MESYYEINVSLNGRHLFATNARSIKHVGDLKKVYGIMIEKFPVKEGYSVSVTHWQGSGESIDMDKI